MRSALALVVVCGCAVGAPPGFSRGDTWTFPLVDPLADGKLVTPVYIEGRGPYLFAIDPDAPMTVADRVVIANGEFRPHPGPRVVDEHDTTHPTYYAPLTNLRIGDLTISLDTVQVSDRPNVFGDGQRRIYGVLGRDVVADSVVFGFDRDRGIAWLQTQEAFHAPPAAQVIAYIKGTREHYGVVVRRLVTADINGTSYDLHLDLGDVPSQLRYQHWPDAKLRETEWNMMLVDEVGSRRAVPVDGIADRVTAGGVTREQLGFVPYDDRRWEYGQLEGTLGLDFFRPFSVAADWHHQKFYLTPRDASPGQATVRLARWGAALPGGCAAAGCATITVTRTALVPATELGIVAPTRPVPHAEAIAHVSRDPGASGVALEVVLAATSPTGAALPRLYVHVPANVDTFSTPVEPRYAGATFAVLDTSPFPRDCGGCITMDVPLAP